MLDPKNLGKQPVMASLILELAGEICCESHTFLKTTWLADVAELFFTKKDIWANKLEKPFMASWRIIKDYFNSINTLLSIQLRMLIMNSLRHFKDLLKIYLGGNKFTGDYKDYIFNK